MAATAINKQRVEWVDCCKGICILLVVYGHTAGGLEASRVLTADSIFARLRDWVYLFHIPAFFFLSGLFAQRTSEGPFVAFLRGRLRVLFYPYLVWTAIFLASQFAMARFVNTPPSLSRALQCLWEPYGVGLWFLYTLFLISLLFAGFRRLRVPAIPTLLFGLIAYCLAHYKVFGFWYVLNASMGHAIFFMLGGCYPGIITHRFGRSRGPVLVSAGVGLFVFMTASRLISSNPAGSLDLASALLGVGGVICVAMALARTAAAGPWTFLGRYSLEIYLAHPLWATASRGLLLKVGVLAPVVFVICGVMSGVLGSLTLALLCRRFGFPYLFRWPAKTAAETKTHDGTGSVAPSART